ncbi:MAG: glycosyltransferase family A protein [Acidimicrobiales bacterium]
MTAASVSVVVPVYNGERYLAETLAAIRNQTHPVAEIIVVDDGSSDTSAEVAAAAVPSAKVLRRANMGAAAAMNAGVTVARGDLLTFCDADDLWHPTKTERQVAALAEMPSAGYSITDVVNFISPELAIDPDSVDAWLLEPAAGYYTATLAVWRSAFDEIGPFDESLRHMNKTEWFLRAREHSEVAHVTDVLVQRRLHTTNTSTSCESSSLDEHLEFVAARMRAARGGRNR